MLFRSPQRAPPSFRRSRTSYVHHGHHQLLFTQKCASWAVILGVCGFRPGATVPLSGPLASPIPISITLGVFAVLATTGVGGITESTLVSAVTSSIRRCASISRLTRRRRAINRLVSTNSPKMKKQTRKPLHACTLALFAQEKR